MMKTSVGYFLLVLLFLTLLDSSCLKASDVQESVVKNEAKIESLENRIDSLQQIAVGVFSGFSILIVGILGLNYFSNRNLARETARKEVEEDKEEIESIKDKALIELHAIQRTKSMLEKLKKKRQ